MERRELQKLLEVIATVAYDPNEQLAFTGRSIADIAQFLINEVESHPKTKEWQFVAEWAKNAPAFRKRLRESARAGGSTIRFNGRTIYLIREDDAASAASESHKGIDYPYPDEW